MVTTLQGQAAIVTGAAQGLGLAISRAYAQAGMRVAMMDVQADALQEAAARISEAGGECLPLAADLASVKATRRAVRDALDWAPAPRVLVHNAAVLRERSLLDLSLKEWQATVNVGIQAAFLLTQAVWPAMQQAGGGSVVYVSSRSGVEGFAGEAAYCTAKHGLEGLMKSLALEGQAANIAVNTITPGMYMHTPMSEQNYPEELKQKWVDPMRLTPAFLTLAWQDGGGITGHRLNAWHLSQNPDGPPG